MRNILKSTGPWLGLVAAGALAGCASTQVATTGNAPAAPLCQARGETLTALVLWAPAWRADQKDVPAREAAAQQGLESFLATSGCFARHDLRRLPRGTAPTDDTLRTAARSASPPPDRVLAVTVRELGPVVKLLSSAALVEGGTEAVLAVRAVDGRSGSTLADFQTHWQNGGALVVKGTGTLAQDMRAALASALRPTS